MQCKKCNYRLWNLPTRSCPECGEPFLPSQFEFEPNSVQFCCPHCAQPYYGTTEKGHLEPLEFLCVTCGRHVHMDTMILLPAEGVREEETRFGILPWLNRKEIGFFRGWFATIGKSLVAPGKMIQLTPPASSLMSAWWFMTLTHVVVIGVGVGPVLLLPLVAGIGTAARGGGAYSLLHAAFVLGMLLLVALAFLTAFVLIWIPAAHVILRVTGSCAGGIRRTFQAITYSSGANIISGIPLCGLYFGWIWWLISSVIAIKDAQKVHGFRASVATLVFPLLALAAAVVGYAYFIFTLLPMTTQQLAPASVSTLRLALIRHAMNENDLFPLHAIELTQGWSVSADDFYVPMPPTWNTASQLQSAMLPDGTSLSQFESLSPSAQEQVIVAVLQKMPSNWVAHRVGDFVFTYNGIDILQDDPNLWLLIYFPERLDMTTHDDAQGSDHDEAQTHEPSIYVGVLDDGDSSSASVLEFTSEEFNKELKHQNELRQAAGLPPLPHPSTVTHQSPR